MSKLVLGRDKLYHLLVGIVIGFISVKIVDTTLINNLLIGTALGAVAGIAKEVYDARHPDKHTADVWDALFTVLGAILGSLLGCF